MRVGKLQKAIDVLLKAEITPLLIGHAGIGKTESVRQYAKDNNLHLIEIRLGQLADAGDVVGLAEINKTADGTLFTNFIMPRIFAEALSSDKKFIIFLDEINRATKDLLQSIFELVYDGSISSNGFSLKNRGYVIAAQNPDTDGYDVLSFSDDAFSSRFCQIKVESNTQDWLAYVRASKTVNNDVIRYIEASPESLNKSKSEFSISTNYNSRSWTRVSKLQDLCKNNDILFELVEGIIGQEQTNAFFSFLERNKIITANDVLDNLPKFQQELSNAAKITEKDSELDLIVNINNSLLALLKTINDTKEESGDESTSPLNEQQRENLCVYMTLLPGDMLFMFYENLLAYRHIISPPNSVPYVEGKAIRGYPMTDDRIKDCLLKYLNVTEEFILNYKF